MCVDLVSRKVDQIKLGGSWTMDNSQNKTLNKSQLVQNTLLSLNLMERTMFNKHRGRN